MRPGHASARRKRGPNPSDEALGRSRGGLTTKLHLSCDGKGRRLSVVITAGQRHESTQLEAVLAGIQVPTPVGQVRKRPKRLVADKGYGDPRCRRVLRKRKIPHVIPERKDQKAQRAVKGSKGGRPPAFDRAAYRRRNVVERMISRLKEFRRVATRYDKRALNYRAFVVLAAIHLWLARFARHALVLVAFAVYVRRQFRAPYQGGWRPILTGGGDLLGLIGAVVRGTVDLAFSFLLLGRLLFWPRGRHRQRVAL